VWTCEAIGQLCNKGQSYRENIWKQTEEYSDTF
jgi:hypothetical protein